MQVRISYVLLAFVFFFAVNAAVAQTNPSLEFADGDGNPTGATTSVVGTTTIQFRKNTDNATGNTFATYSNPSPLKVTFTLDNQQYTQTNTTGYNGGVYLGYPNEAILVLMNAFGQAGINSLYTSSLSTVGTGIDVTANRAIQINNNVQPLTAAGRACNARWQMADLTITFSRPVNDPYLQIDALGGSGNGKSYTAEFDYVSSNTAVSFSKISGNNQLNVTATQILNSAATPDGTTAANTAAGTVKVSGTNITTLKLRIYTRGASSNWGTNWGNGIAGDGYMFGVSVAESDLAITKTVDNSTPLVGSNVKFTLTAQNNGASNNTNVKVSDLLPSGYTYVSSNPSQGTYTNATGVWAVGTLNDQASATLDITATVNASGSYTNAATITGDLNDPSSANNSASVTPTPKPAVSITYPNSAYCKNGSNPTPTITISPSSGISGVFSAPAGLSVSTTTGQVNLAGSSPGTYTVTYTTTATGTYASNTATTSITVNPIPTVSGSMSSNPVCAGNSVSLTGTFTASGTSTTASTWVWSGPNSYTSSTQSPSISSVVSANAGVYTVTVTDNNGCSNSASTSSLTVNPLPNAYSITGGGSYCASGSGVPVGLSNSQSGINYQLQLNGSNSGASVTGTGSAISFGNQISAGTYTVMATNTTTGCSTGMTGSVAVTVNSLPATPTVSSAMVSNTCPATTVDITALVTSSIPSGCSILYKTTNDPTGTSVADPTKAGSGTYYLFYNNNTSGCSSFPATPVTVTIHSCNDLSITKAVSDMNPLVGTEITFTITAYNGSTTMVTATEVKVADKLLPNYAFKSYTVTTGTYDNATGIWTIGSLSPKSSAVLTITATVQ
ncbi:MAG: DUF11 domain-containing protein [Bacteroidota bacterium]|nr:DUF11 domain-containing protein [Bacteroidota bacterium]